MEGNFFSTMVGATNRSMMDFLCTLLLLVKSIEVLQTNTLRMLHVLINYCFYQPLYDNIIEKQALDLPRLLYFPKESFLHSQHWHKKLLGRLMLVDISKKLNPQLNPEEVKFNAFGKPVFPDVFVSLSYTGDIIIVAACIDGNIGIDIEKLCPVDLASYQNHFTEGELDYINNSINTMEAFYEMWTRKESVLKADGRGFTIDPLGTDVTAESVMLPDSDEKWGFLTFKLNDNYIVTLSTSIIPSKIEFREVFPDSISHLH